MKTWIKILVVSLIGLVLVLMIPYQYPEVVMPIAIGGYIIVFFPIIPIVYMIEQDEERLVAK